VRFEVHTAVTMNTGVIWKVTLCSSVDQYLDFGSTYFFHLQDRRMILEVLIAVTAKITFAYDTV
jgi:hypothetical protein